MKINFKKYAIYKVILLTLIIISFFIIVSFSHVLGFRSLRHTLINYQLNKLNDNNIETIFIGDSSLGSAIDAKVWQNESQSKTVNLALGGNFSFGGAYALFKKAYKKNDKIKNVIIINSINGWRNEVSHQGYKYIKNQNNFIMKSLYYLDDNFYNIKVFYYNFFFNENKNYSNFIVNDYMFHGKYKIEKNVKIILDPLDYNKEKIYYLKKIYNLCDSKNVNCVYFHGPIYETFCKEKSSLIFLKKINFFLKEENFIFDDHLFCLSHEKMSDTINHVIFDYKGELTKRYFERFKNISNKFNY